MSEQKNLFDTDSSNPITSSHEKIGVDHCNKNPEKAPDEAPLAHRLRPETLEEFEGLSKVLKKYSFLSRPSLQSIILYGPSGVGKTTLARLLATSKGYEFYKFNAVLGGVADLKKLIQSADEMRERYQHKVVIFIDEIHRFNKAQQDALLPYVEEGHFILIGATTENPRTSLNKALLSRLQIVRLEGLSLLELKNLLDRANIRAQINIPNEYLEIIPHYCRGDARVALNSLELLAKVEDLSIDKARELILEKAREYDLGDNRHYDVISAFIKSLRGSDPQAAILYLAIMLDGGEDPVFIARRLMIFASEDVGNADPNALTLATSGLAAVQAIGMPEARIILAQITTYLASTYKSNASYLAINEAMEYVENSPTIDVPEHLKNYPHKNHPVQYLYPHSYPEHFVVQEYAPKNTPIFYRPTNQGREEGLRARLQSLKTKK